MKSVARVILLQQGHSMLAGAIKALKSTMRSSMHQRLVCVVCAVAFLTVGFVHCIHELGTPTPTLAMQMDVGTLGDKSDTSKKAPGAVEHCHACSMIAMMTP